jgi:hypothetical protein
MKATVALVATLAISGGVVLVQNHLEEAPPSEWLAVRSVVVHPSIEGRPPVLSVEREIKKRFFGEWSATVRKSTEEGFVIACAATGSNEYQTDSQIPKPLTLDWWTFPIKCDLPAGTYRLDTVWKIKAPGYPDKHLTYRSNLFTVSRKDEKQ